MSKVSVNIIIYNGLKYIKPCIDSIFNQTFKDFEIIIIDNNSNDNSVDFIKNNYSNNIKIVENKTNNGFSGGHNQAFLLNTSEYILVTNQDIILEPDFIEKMVNFMDSHNDYASCGGRLLKMKFNNDLTIEKTNIIDCLGLEHTSGYRFFNIGEGSIFDDKYNMDVDVFGVSGALVMYRRNAIGNLLYDDRFFMYKEDIDLAWKLLNKGFKSRYISNAIAYHERGYTGEQKKGLDILNLLKIISRKNNDKNSLSYLSYRNHLLMLNNNLNKLNIYIVYEEIKKGIFNLLFKPSVFFKSWKDLLTLYKKT